MKYVYVYKDVPESDVEQVEENCRNDGATEVVKGRQDNGLWKVTCTYPDKPATSEK